MEPVIDAHCDTFLWQYTDHHDIHLPVLPQFSHFSGEKMREGGVNIEVFATFIPESMITQTLTAKELAMRMISEGRDYLERERIQVLSSKKELLNAALDGSFGILGLEGAIPLGKDPMALNDFFDTGVRILTMVWSRENAFASGVGYTGGLTRKGIDLITIAGELGVVVDISHMNTRGVDDVLQYSEKPIIASHSNTCDLNPHPRNLTNDQIESISHFGGVIGVNFCPDFLSATGDATIDTVVDHIETIVEIGGIGAVGIGSDFDGIPVTPEGLEDISRVGALGIILKDRGFNNSDIEKVMGGNLKRVFMDVMR